MISKDSKNRKTLAMNPAQTHLTSKNLSQALVITGLSGAGKASIMRALEDIGFYCVDNLPTPLLSTFLKLTFQQNTPNSLRIALCLDARDEKFFQHFVPEISRIKRENIVPNLQIIFVNAREQTILKRFQETRRKHPLSTSNIPIEKAIENEKKLMEPIMGMATINLDTDALNIHQLRKIIKTQFAEGTCEELCVNLVSFGFKYGIPTESNLIFDLRFLPNPYFVPELKNFDGRAEQIGAYLWQQDPVQHYWKHLRTFLDFSLPKFKDEGRFFVTVGIGCTGGRHRSVAFVERLYKETWDGICFVITHRDIDKT